MNGDRENSHARHGLLRRLAVPGLMLAVLTCAIVLAAYLLRSSPVPVPKVTSDSMHPAVLRLLDRQRTQVETNPQNAKVWGGYGMSLQQHGRLKEALHCYKQAEQLSPEEPKWPYLAGVILEQTDATAALANFERVRRLAPEYTPADLRSVELLLARGQADTALAILEQSALQGAAPAVVIVLRLRLMQPEEDWQTVQSTLEMAKQSSTASQELFLEAGRLALLEGRPDRAEALQKEAAALPPLAAFRSDPWIEELMVLDTSGAATSMQADALRQQGEIQQAAGLLARLARQFPDRSRPELNYALTLAETGQMVLAMSHLENLLDRFPDDPLIYFSLATLELESAQRERAEDHLLEAVRLKPDYSAAWGALAQLYTETDRHQQAQEAFELAVSASPENTQLKLMFADFLLSSGKRDEARDILDKSRDRVVGQQELQQQWNRLNEQYHASSTPNAE